MQAQAGRCLSQPGGNRVASKMRVVRGIGGGRPPRNIGPSQIDAHPGLDPGRVPCSTTRLGRLGSADKSETEGDWEAVNRPGATCVLRSRCTMMWSADAAAGA